MQHCYGKSSIQKEVGFFHQHIGLKVKEETGKVLHLEHGFVWCWNLDTSGSGSEIPGKFWNVVLEKDGDHLDRSCEEWRSVTESRRIVLHTANRRKANWIDHILRRNCLLKQVTEGKVEGMIEVAWKKDVSSYWMNLGKKEDTVNWKKKH